MEGFNWVYKNIQLFRWCQVTLPASVFDSLLSQFNHSIVNNIQYRFVSNNLWINLFEICFPQKYMFYQMQSGGNYTADLQLLFSSKGSIKPADCILSVKKLYDPSPSVDGLPLICPVLSRECEHNTKRRQGNERRI
jgi:hypothetical protein